MKKCKKKKFDEVGAMLVIAKAIRSKNHKRQERRYYWCVQCRTYHVTKN